MRYAPGPGRVSPDYSIVASQYLAPPGDTSTTPGLRGEYFDNNTLTGSARVVRTDANVNFGWTLSSPARGIPYDWYSVRWTGTITVPPGGLRRIGVEGNDGYRLFVDDRPVIDDWHKQSYGVRLADVHLAPGASMPCGWSTSRAPATRG